MNQINSNEELHQYLQTQFNDLAGAKKFMWYWKNDMDQSLPDGTELTVRAMAAHCSYVLEGINVEEGAMFVNYLSSKYGTDLYVSAWGI